MLLLSYLLYLKLSFLHIMVLSNTPNNPTKKLFYECSSYSCNITIKNYDSFGSYDKVIYGIVLNKTFIMQLTNTILL